LLSYFFLHKNEQLGLQSCAEHAGFAKLLQTFEIFIPADKAAHATDLFFLFFIIESLFFASRNDRLKLERNRYNLIKLIQLVSD